MKNINEEVLNFVVFMIESYKIKYNITGKETYDLFNKYDVFSYLIEGYDLLHTLGRDYLVNDVNEYIMNRKKPI